MKALRDKVENLPSKIYSKLTPTTTHVSSDSLRLEKVMEKLPDETGQMLFYAGKQYRFGVEDETHFWVRVESQQEFNLDDVRIALDSPGALSGASKERKRRYTSVVSKGKVDESRTGKNYLTVIYSVRPRVDLEELSEAFWYVYRPLLLFDRKKPT